LHGRHVHIRHQHGQGQDQGNHRGDQAHHGGDGQGGDPQRYGAFEQDNPAVQFDAPGDKRAQPDQGGQVEHVGA
jgi:hypothetical protein